MANEPNEVRDANIRRLRSEQEKEHQLVNNLLGEMNRYMLQKLDRAEEETRIGALRSPLRELRNELKYVQSGVKMNEISCLKVRHTEHKIWLVMLPLLRARAGWVQKMGFLGQNGFEASELMRARPTCGHECSSESSPMMTNTQTPPPATTVESLEHKYKTDDAGTKKFVVACFLDYKMVDSKNVISQVQDLQVDFKNYLKHTRKKMSVEDLVVRLRIEEDDRLAQKDTYIPDSAKANMTEHAGSSLRFQGTCYNCDQPGHRAANCKMPKRVNPHQANIVNNDVDMIAMVSDVCAMISEVNLVGTNHGGWWIDTGATRHVCADKSMFHSFRAVDNGQKLYMGNSATDDIKGEGDVVLKMTSEKELKLTNVLYVPEIHKNLVSGWLLNKFGFRLVFESDKFVLSKNQMYVGRGYAMNGMFKLNVMVVKNEINKMNSSAYLIESSNVWHGRLGHVNFNLMRRLIKFNCIPNFHIDSKYKCETCVEAKLTRTSFKSVKRKTEPLDMVHTGICDLKSLPTKGGNKYFITFIDDCTKYCYVYLLKSKDEAIGKFVLYKTEVESQLGKKIKVVRSDRGGEYVSPFA
ncbi:retrovirus-related pol polyprotein from transposon TNT 1-94 [Tanacetum coccineum]|uniref:Retrovirus-related pol polyprotein from transposon TNT 1-94 n=1 Tax=Tanacetum coccineum TaxID=301880 RepID=A0ABQ5F9G8_9ASTR